MSLLLDKQQEIADRMLPKEITLKGLIQALKAKIIELMQIITQKDTVIAERDATIAQQAEEIVSLNETLANIGTPAQFEAIMQPVELQQDENITLAQ